MCVTLGHAELNTEDDNKIPILFLVTISDSNLKDSTGDVILDGEKCTSNEAIAMVNTGMQKLLPWLVRTACARNENQRYWKPRI